MNRNIFISLIFIFLLIFIAELGICKGKDKREVVFIPEKDLPRKIAVLGPFALNKKNIDISAFGLVKNVIKNYMAGKGYIVRHVDEGLSRWNPNFKEIEKLLSKNSDLDGVLLIGVHQLSSFNIAFAQYYKMDGELCLYNKKKKLGCWRESATRKKVSIATDPLGAIATLVSSVISSSGNVHIKNVIFEWAFKISSLIPTFSSAIKKPKIFRVITNITEKPFKMGDKIMVGIEGSPGGSAFFEITPLIKKVPMSEVQNGIYKGMYVVKEGDKLVNGVLHVVLENDRGEKRDWMETDPLINIDGIPPNTPSSFSAIPTKSSIKLKWNTTDSEVVGFVLFRSTNPLSGYIEIAKVKNFSYEDKGVEEGKTYFYRLIALDKVGNSSKPAQVGPVSLPVFTQKPLPSMIVSDLVPGRYYLNGVCSVPLGVKVRISNSQITFRQGSLLKIEGLVVMDSVLLNYKKEKELNKIQTKKDKKEMIKSENKDTNLKKVGNPTPIKVNNEDIQKGDVKDKRGNDKSKENKIIPSSPKDVQKGQTNNKGKSPQNSFTGIIVFQTGALNMTGVQIEDIPDGILVRGKLTAKRFSILRGNKGIVINSLKENLLESGTFKSLQEAIEMVDGALKVSKCRFEQNNTAINIKGGEVYLTFNNFIRNNINVASDIKLLLEKNFLGSTEDFKLKGKVGVKSFLDGPYPSGKEIRLSDIIKKAREDKKKAMEFLNKRNYGKAVELFKRIVKLIPDVDTYIYYIYALSMVNDKAIEGVIEEAIKKYPYKTKLYHLGVRYYLQANEMKKAKALWQKGIKLNPDDPLLNSMAYYFKGISKEEEKVKEPKKKGAIENKGNKK